MSRFSRPRRTRLYDCNYDMGERYYKPMVDHLDRKYTPGRPSDEIARHFSPLADTRRREQTPEEVRRRPMTTLMDEFEAAPSSRANGHREDSLGMTDEMAASMRRIAESKAARQAIEDEISEIAAMRSSRKKGQFDFGEKMMDSVGLSSKATEDDGVFTTKRRVLKMTSSTADAEDDGSVTKWTALKGSSHKMAADFDEDTGSTAMMRARMSRNRLADLDSEMEEIADRTAARERRNNHLRAFLQETKDSGDEVLASSMKVKKTTFSQKSDKKTVTF